MSQPINVLSVNVRLTEGGAAKVMLSIHDYLITQGVKSRLAYGYGQKGKESPEESKLDALMLSNQFRAASNLFFHNAIGIDLINPSQEKKSRFQGLVEESDLIHLHAIHSYFWRFDDLFELLGESNKPVVWTMHDSWILTGRCAFNDDCRKWETGCGGCPSKNFYPASIFDFSGPQWKEKRNAVSTLEKRGKLSLVSVSEWLAKDLSLGGFGEVAIIRNGTDSKFWQACLDLKKEKIQRAGLLFLNRDLRDSYKVSVETLNKIAATGIPLTVLGDFPPPELSKDIRLLPSTRSRSDLARVMAEHEALIFTSKVDNYPLTVVEALVAGLQVRLPAGKVAEEFRNYPQVNPYNSEEDLLANPISSTIEYNLDFSAFEPSRMPSDYLELYQGILS